MAESTTMTKPSSALIVMASPLPLATELCMGNDDINVGEDDNNDDEDNGSTLTIVGVVGVVGVGGGEGLTTTTSSKTVLTANPPRLGAEALAA